VSEGFRTELARQLGAPVDFHDAALERASALPPNSAILFGLFDFQISQEIVGGPLLSLRDLSRRTASVAVRILLRGEAPGGLAVAEVVPGVAVFALVLADGAPLALAEVEAPFRPRGFRIAGLLQALRFGVHVASLVTTRILNHEWTRMDTNKSEWRTAVPKPNARA
jgi:hypothetical protein